MAVRWTPAEDAALRRLYAGLRLPLADISTRLGRSEDALVARRRALGIAPRRPPAAAWSAAQDELLRLATRQGVQAGALADHLGRSISQVRSRRRIVAGIRPAARAYTRQEDELLRAHLARGEDLAELADELRRSVDALRLHAQSLGLYRPTPRRRWADWEDATIREGYTTAMPCAEIARELPDRSAQSIAARAAKLGLTTYARRWSALDDRRMRSLVARGLPIEHVARQLSRTPEALRQRARRLGINAPGPLPRPRAGLRWSAAEDDRLRLLHALNPARLAELLGRSDAAVCRRLCALGLRSRARRSPHHPGPTRPVGSSTDAVQAGEVLDLFGTVAPGMVATARSRQRPSAGADAGAEARTGT